jgi:serine protease AprX
MAKVSRNLETVSPIVFVVALLVALNANAGQQLRFKSGTVTTTQPIVRGYSGTLNQDAQGPSRFFIIQFKRKIGAAQNAEMQNLGIKTVRYIPDDALIVETSVDKLLAIKKSADVQAVLPFMPEWKLSNDLDPASVFTGKTADEILIRTLDNKLTPQIANRIDQTGGEVKYNVGRSIVARITREQLMKIASIDGVEWIQPNVKLKIMDADLLDDGGTTPAPGENGTYESLSGFESGTKIMKTDVAWSRGFYGEGQLGVIADTGFDRGDANNVPADFTGRIDGQIFGMFSENWADNIGHGTHVSGSIIGDGTASDGKLAGSAPKAKLTVQGMWSPVLGGLTPPPTLSELFQPAYDAGARVHSNSWGSSRGLGSYDAYAVQVDEFMYTHPEFLLLFAAGNNGADLDKDGRIDPGSISTPATAKNALTVGASENLVTSGGIQTPLIKLRNGTSIWSVEPLASDLLSNNPNGLAGFSSRGPTLDGRTKPDIVAPGTNILSSRSQLDKAGTLWGPFNQQYVWSGGTSMATPLTAGVALLTREYLIKAKNIAAPSAALVKNVLMHTAFDIFPGQFGEVGKENGQEILKTRPTSDAGFGRVDADRATKLDSALLVDEKTGVGTDEKLEYKFAVQNAGTLTISLVWTDAPGAPEATKALVNDLKLEILGPDRAVHTVQNDVDNSEFIAKDALPGEYEIRVVGVNVPVGGKQPFALVVSAQ